MQNFIKLSAAVHELPTVEQCTEKKNSNENNTVRRYRADSDNGTITKLENNTVKQQHNRITS